MSIKSIDLIEPTLNGDGGGGGDAVVLISIDRLDQSTQTTKSSLCPKIHLRVKTFPQQRKLFS